MVRANAAGCLDQCARGVTVVVYPEQCWYGGVKVEDVRQIVEDHLIGGVPAKLIKELSEDDKFLVEYKTRPDLPDDV